MTGEAWCRFCGKKLRPQDGNGDWPECLHCGAKYNHHTHNKDEAGRRPSRRNFEYPPTRYDP